MIGDDGQTGDAAAAQQAAGGAIDGFGSGYHLRCPSIQVTS
jgi:hypothetical protein